MRANQPSAQLLEYMRKKNIVKRSYAPPADQDAPQQPNQAMYQLVNDVREAVNEAEAPLAGEYEALVLDEAPGAQSVEPVHSDDFDAPESEHGFKEELARSLQHIKQNNVCTEYENIFDVDQSPAFYLKK